MFSVQFWCPKVPSFDTTMFAPLSEPAMAGVLVGAGWPHGVPAEDLGPDGQLCLGALSHQTRVHRGHGRREGRNSLVYVDVF